MEKSRIRRQTPALLAAGVVIAMICPLQAGGPLFPNPVLPVGFSPTGIGVADFNSDGWDDVIVTNSSSRDATLLLGRGDGSFEAGRSVLSFGGALHRLEVADINGDHIPDLVVISGDFVLVSLGTGDGHFLEPRAFGSYAVSNLTDLAIGEFNHDGVPDIAVTGQGANQLAILQGVGQGSFFPIDWYSVGVPTFAVDLGDLDENGTQDIIFTAKCGPGQPCPDGGIFIFSGAGDGTFVQTLLIQVSGTPEAIMVEDLDHDGHLDVVVPDGGDLLIHAGNGDGTFAAAETITAGISVQEMTSSDLDRDGHADIIVIDGCSDGGANCVAGSVVTLMGQGSGAFGAPISCRAGVRPREIEVGDFNTDGVPDLAVMQLSPASSTNGLAELFLGRGDGTFPALEEVSVPYFGSNLYSGDLDVDGLDELLTIGPPLRVIRRGAGGVLDQLAEYSIGGDPRDLTLGDFNADGRVDVAVANNSTDDVSVLLGAEGGNLEPEIRYPTPINPSAIVAADFNNDQIDDLAVTTTGHGSGSIEIDDVVILLARGDGGFEAPVPIAVTSDPEAVVAGDFDSDGNRDLAIGGGAGACGVYVLRGHGDGSFALEGPYATTCHILDIAIGDVDGDGDEDLAVSNIGGVRYAPNVDVLLGDGQGGFTAGPGLIGGGFTVDMRVGDVNNDGYDDVALLDLGIYGSGQANSPSISIWTATGSGAFASRTTYYGGYAPGMTLGRFTGDGRVSIALTGDASSGSQHLWLLGNVGPGRDADGDGIENAVDPCTDTDGDGFGDREFAANICPDDNCPSAANHDQADVDGDGIGDACDRCSDSDGDGAGYPDFGINRCFPDNCPDVSNRDQSDLDGDEIGDACDFCTDPDGDGFGTPGLPAGTCPDDNCPDDTNPLQIDADSDGAGDPCDQCPFDPLNDWDYDFVCGDVDNCATVRNADQSDLDDDGLGGLCDNCPSALNPDQEDANGDGDGDACQPSLELLEIREDGGEYLEVTVAASDPQDEPLSGTVDIRSTGLQGFALPDISTVGDCNAAILPDGIAGNGIAFAYARFRQPYLVDLDFMDSVLRLGCGDGIGDYTFGVGRCDDPETIPTTAAMRIFNLAFPAAICAFENAPGVDRIDLTLSSVSPYLLEGEVTTIVERTTSFQNGLPRMIDLSGMSASGEHLLAITVADGNTLPVEVESAFIYQGESSMIFNSPPRASFDLEPVIECDSPQGASVILDARSSSDGDSTPGTEDDIESYEWFEDLGLPGERTLGSGPILDATLRFGQHDVALRVTDTIGISDTTEMPVVVRDSTPPAVGLFVSPSVLWPPNHRMVKIDVSWQIDDLCDEHPSVSLIAVSSNEPDEAPGPGDGHTYGDIAGADIGAADTELNLRAERSGSGPGRIYELLYRATDSTGNMMPAFGIVTVPHDAGAGSEPLILRLGQVGAGGDALISWTAVEGATGYDVIAADMAGIGMVNGTLGLGDVEVLARHTWMTGLADREIAPIVPLGQARILVIQSRSGSGGQGYGTESASLPRVPGSCTGGCP